MDTCLKIELLSYLQPFLKEALAIPFLQWCHLQHFSQHHRQSSGNYSKELILFIRLGY